MLSSIPLMASVVPAVFLLLIGGLLTISGVLRPTHNTHWNSKTKWGLFLLGMFVLLFVVAIAAVDKPGAIFALAVFRLLIYALTIGSFVGSLIARRLDFFLFQALALAGFLYIVQWLL